MDEQQILNEAIEIDEDSKEFDYINLPSKRISPFLSKDLSLRDMHAQCIQELTLQQSKRDQLIAFYLTITGLVSTYLFSSDVDFAIRTAIFASLFIIGFIWSVVIIRYRVYKDIYWACAKTISTLFTANRSKIDKSLVQHTFYKVLEKSYKDVAKNKSNPLEADLIQYTIDNITSAEYLMFLTLVLLSSFSGAAFLLSIFSLLKLGFINYILVFLILSAYIVLQTVSYNKAVLSVFKVVVNKKNKTFNKIFKKAWLLHFFI